MENNKVFLLVFFLIILLVVRGYMGLTIRLSLSKKERKNYQTNTSILNRWFFVSAHHFVKNKFNKYEKKVIPYPSILKLYRGIMVLLHSELAVVLIFSVLSSMLEVFSVVYNYICWTYTGSLLVSFILLTIIEFKSNRRYHRNRYR